MDAYSHGDRPTPVFLGSPPTDRATLACQPCRRRKAKCDRLLPNCNVCARTLQTCIYPAKRLKPGPKIGSTQRGRKRVRFNSHGSIASQDMPQSSSRGYPASRQESTSRNSVSDYPNVREASGSATTQSSYQTLRLANSRSPDSYSTAPTHSTDDEFSDPSKDPANVTAAFLEAMSLANIMHPTHEKATESSNSPPWNVFGTSHDAEARRISLQSGVELGLRVEQLKILTRAYFANMTSFTLFYQPTIRQKMYAITDQTQNKALVAAVCAFAARHVAGHPNLQGNEDIPIIQDHARFHKLALKWVFEAIQECEDDTPPLCVLQALVLTTFYQLTEGVRGRAWRLLGTCVRIAYEQRLNFIDIDRSETCADVEQWVLNEERRRCWWAIWEMDTFASSIRRTPSAIDWTTNETYLPVKDEQWFNKQYQKSCVLELNPVDRIPSLTKSGNRSADAWFIVLDSLMREAQLLSNMSTVLPDIDPQNNVAQMIQYFQNQFKGRKSEDAEKKLPPLDQALRAFTTNLPDELAYRGEPISFRKGEHLTSAMMGARRHDVAKYSIHLTFQLTKIMINHHYAFREVVAGKRYTENSMNTNLNWNTPEPEVPTNAQGLQNCMDGADDILAILTKCSEGHVQFVSPFHASTIWLATALQVLRKVFAPGDSNSDLIVSKCEMLRSHCEQYSQVWGTPLALLENLDSLEERLREKQRQRYDDLKTASTFSSRRTPEKPTQYPSSDEQNAAAQQPEPLDWMTWQQQTYFFNPDAGFNTVQGIPTESYVQGIPMQNPYMQVPYPDIADGNALPFAGHPSMPGAAAPATSVSGHTTGNVDPTMEFDNGFSSYLQALMAESYTR